MGSYAVPEGICKRRSVPIFSSIPTKREMTFRCVPDQLLGHPKVVGHSEEIDSLFKHTRSIAQQFFSRTAFECLFPASFAPSMPAKTKADLSLETGFHILNNLTIDNKGRLDDLIDFCLLYVGLVIVIGTNDHAVTSLRFLNHFLDLGLSRTGESHILFAILTRSFNRPGLRPIVVRCLAKMARLEPSLIERIQKGTTHHDSESSSFFNAVLRRVGGPDLGHPIFQPILARADEQFSLECLEDFADSLADSGHPDDITSFLVNVVSTMARFPTSPPIVELGANCITSILPFAPDVSAEILFECLAICVNDDSPAAALGLMDAVVAHVRPAIARAAMTPLVALASGDILRGLFARLEAIDGASNPDLIGAFHPEWLDRQTEANPLDEYEKSLSRLADPAEVMGELARIIAQRKLSGYPLRFQVLFQSMCIAIPATNREEG
jgi:hypothetical protein